MKANTLSGFTQRRARSWGMPMACSSMATDTPGIQNSTRDICKCSMCAGRGVVTLSAESIEKLNKRLSLLSLFPFLTHSHTVTLPLSLSLSLFQISTLIHTNISISLYSNVPPPPTHTHIHMYTHNKS